MVMPVPLPLVTDAIPAWRKSSMPEPWYFLNNC